MSRGFLSTTTAAGGTSRGWLAVRIPGRAVWCTFVSRRCRRVSKFEILNLNVVWKRQFHRCAGFSNRYIAFTCSRTTSARASTHEKAKIMLLRRLALWVLAVAPASLTTCFVVQPGIRRPSEAVFQGDRLSYVRGRTQKVATSAASGAVVAAAQRTPSCDTIREDAHAATTRTGFVLAGGRVAVAASAAVTTATAAAAAVAVPPAIAAEREPEITSKCFIEVSQMCLSPSQCCH